MNDPHVQAVYYSFKPRAGVLYDNPPAVAVSRPTFDGELRATRFAARMTVHFPTIEEARVSVDAFLRAWEMTASLRSGYAEFRFEYDYCDIVDRDPPPPGTIQPYAVTGQGGVTISGTGPLSVTLPSYPPLPPVFLITPLVKMLWDRYMRYVAGNEPLFDMGYFCLTVLESYTGRRNQIARRYKVELAILDKIGELSSSRGGPADARKMTKTQFTPATIGEQEWLKQAIRSLILQLGAVEAGDMNSRLVMSQLPKL